MRSYHLESTLPETRRPCSVAAMMTEPGSDEGSTRTRKLVPSNATVAPPSSRRPGSEPYLEHLPSGPTRPPVNAAGPRLCRPTTACSCLRWRDRGRFRWPPGDQDAAVEPARWGTRPHGWSAPPRDQVAVPLSASSRCRRRHRERGVETVPDGVIRAPATAMTAPLADFQTPAVVPSTRLGPPFEPGPVPRYTVGRGRFRPSLRERDVVALVVPGDRNDEPTTHRGVAVVPASIGSRRGSATRPVDEMPERP